jgi:hypothetical protein
MSINKLDKVFYTEPQDPYAEAVLKPPRQFIEDLVNDVAQKVFPSMKDHLLIPSVEEQTKKTVEKAIVRYDNQLNATKLRNPMDYAADLVELQKLGFTHSTPIALAANGRIVPKGAQEASNGLNHQLVIATIAKTFGVEMAERMTRRYRLDKEGSITIGELKRILVGLSANLRVSDLDLLFQKIKQGNHSDILVTEMKKYRPDLFERMKSGEHPTATDYAFAVEMLRLVRVNGEALSVVQALFSDKKEAEEVYEGHNDHYNHFVEWMDYKAIFHAAAWNQLRTDIPGVKNSYDLALAEFFGKSLAYDELRKGMVFTIPNRDSQKDPGIYSLADSLALRSDGVHGFFFREEQLQPGEKQNIHLAFRGTAFSNQMLDAEASLHRDGAIHQIGKSQFSKREGEILFRLKQLLESEPNREIDLTISGHSLGGADAQRALVLITEAVANSDENSPLRRIRKIHCIPHNAPGLEASLNQRFENAINKIKETQLEIDYVMHWFRLEGEYAQDLVQQVGDGFVGANLAGRENLQLRVHNVYNDHLAVNTIFTPGGIQTALDVHSQRVFNPLLHPNDPKIESIDQKERIEAILNRQLPVHWQLEHPHTLVQWVSAMKWPVKLFNGKIHKFALKVSQLVQNLDDSLNHRFI